MQTNSLLKKCTVVCLLFVGIVKMTNLNAQEFIVGDLIYRHITTNEVSVVGHVLGTGVAGGLSIPASINYNGTNYIVTDIGVRSFADCVGLTGIIIPTSVTNIEPTSFLGCSGLSEIYVTYGNPVYDSRGYCNAIIKTTDCELVTGCKNTIIPNSVTSIGILAFYKCSGLTSITIPNSVTSIGEAAFTNCTGLTNITIPNSVTTIGDYAFAACHGLTSITIPNSVTTIGDHAFALCSGLTSITIPNYITMIGEETFGGCSGLTSITIPNYVTTIGDGAFGGCSGLTSITIPASVTIIEDNPFISCSGLTEISVDSGNPIYDSRSNCNAIIKTTDNELISGCKNTVIPNTVTSIGRNAFTGLSSLISITIPNSVTAIGWYAFDRCSSVTEIEIMATTPPAVGNNAFSDFGCLTLTVPCGCIPAYENSIWHYYFPNIIENCSNVEELNENLASIYPNPTSSIVKIKAENIQNISIYNMLGEMVFESAASGDSFEYDFSNNESGVYLVRVKTAQGVVTKRVTVM